MQKRKVLLFTDTFPYGSGESFIETEMLEWEKRNDIELLIFPLLARSTNHCRDIPKNATINLRLNKILNFYEKWIFFVFPIILLNPYFWKEIQKYPKVFLNMKKLRRLVAVSTFSKVIYWFMKKNFADILKKDTLFYSYWFYYAAYGGTLLKRHGFKFKLITRAHGTDVFQNRKETNHYIPFRHFPVWKYLNKIYPVSVNGANYLSENQNIPSNNINVSYLGVKEQDYICNPSGDRSLNIVSCSQLISLKRIELIITGIAHYVKKRENIQMHWYHIGDGPLRSKLPLLANKQLHFTNVDFSFVGNLKNSEVLAFYKNTPLDCFVTTSESEGLPVSIMEAIMVGLPIIATNVGGIKEAVNNSNGFLLNKDFESNDFERALNKMFDFKELQKRTEIAENARNKFSSKCNIGNFIDEALS